MKNKRAITFMLAVSFVIALAAIALGTGSATESMSGIAIGQAVPEFKLTDTNGKAQSLSALKGKNGTVFIFVSTRCPVSNGYNERMEKLAADYKARGINVVGINANSTETADDVKAHATTNHLTFPVLKDVGNKVADIFGAQHTPEAYLLDASGKLVYRGRIDNGRSAEDATSNDLRNALDEVLAGKPVTKAEALAFGCSIKRVS